MSVKVSNDFSMHTRKDSCRSNNCVSACLCCASANRHSVLSCRRSLIRPMIVPHSCAWQKPSRHFLPACAPLQRRLASLNVRKSCACWLKTFWSAKIRLRFVTAFPFPRAHLKTKDRALQKAEITFCVRGVTTLLLPSRPNSHWPEQEHSCGTSSRKPFSLSNPNRVHIAAGRSSPSLLLVGSSVKLPEATLDDRQP